MTKYNSSSGSGALCNGAGSQSLPFTRNQKKPVYDDVMDALLGR